MPYHNDPQEIQTYTIEVEATVLVRIEVEAHSRADALEEITDSSLDGETIAEVFDIDRDTLEIVEIV